MEDGRICEVVEKLVLHFLDPEAMCNNKYRKKIAF